MSQVIALERSVKAGEFRERWLALGFETLEDISNEMAVSTDTVKSWNCGRSPIPKWAWRFLERVESA